MSLHKKIPVFSLKHFTRWGDMKREKKKKMWKNEKKFVEKRKAANKCENTKKFVEKRKAANNGSSIRHSVAQQYMLTCARPMSYRNEACAEGLVVYFQAFIWLRIFQTSLNLSTTNESTVWFHFNEDKCYINELVCLLVITCTAQYKTGHFPSITKIMHEVYQNILQS